MALSYACSTALIIGALPGGSGFQNKSSQKNIWTIHSEAASLRKAKTSDSICSAMASSSDIRSERPTLLVSFDTSPSLMVSSTVSMMVGSGVLAVCSIGGLVVCPLGIGGGKPGTLLLLESCGAS